MYKILKLNDINLNHINFDKPIDSSLLSPKEYKKGFNISYINYNDDPLLIELPSLLLKSYNNEKKTLLLTLKSKNNKYDNDLNNFFYKLDKLIISNISHILKSLKIKTKDLNYISILQSNEDDDKYIKLKISNDTKIYNINKQLIINDKNINMILDKTYIGSIIQIVSILFNHDVIFVNIKLHQIRISYHLTKKIILSNYSFNDSDESQNDCNITDSYIHTLHKPTNIYNKFSNNNKNINNETDIINKNININNNNNINNDNNENINDNDDDDNDNNDMIDEMTENINDMTDEMTENSESVDIDYHNDSD
jgi:hypothetical protein